MRISGNVARNNHYVPRMLLQHWSLDGSTVAARRLLVSTSRVPEWRMMPISGLAYQRDLYTSALRGSNSDEFEKWVADDFERPASEAILKLVDRQRLKRDDWHSLARFFALQDLRTPTRFFDEMARWSRDMPIVMEDTLRRALQELERARSEGHDLETTQGPREFEGVFRVSIIPPEETGATPQLRTDVTLGRAFWLASMRHLLTGSARVLTEHQWTIAEPADGLEWPLSDHPALKLNYSGPGEYDFGGGWGRRRVDLMMPLTPQHLLFTEVGKDRGRRLKFTPEWTWQIQRFLLERADRWVFATRPLDWIARARPRTVDAEQFEHEAEMWSRWHEHQSRVEARNKAQ